MQIESKGYPFHEADIVWAEHMVSAEVAERRGDDEEAEKCRLAASVARFSGVVLRAIQAGESSVEIGSGPFTYLPFREPSLSMSVPPPRVEGVDSALRDAVYYAAVSQFGCYYGEGPTAAQVGAVDVEALAASKGLEPDALKGAQDRLRQALIARAISTYSIIHAALQGTEMSLSPPINPFGGTDVAEAVRVAMAKLGETSIEKAQVIVFTDGHPGEAVRERIAKLREQGVQACFVGVQSN